MYNCISRRDGIIHIIEYYMTLYNTYGTTCCLQIKGKESNTFAVDNIFPGICKKCYEVYAKNRKRFIFERSSLNIKTMNSYFIAKAPYNSYSVKYNFFNRKRAISRLFYKR